MKAKYIIIVIFSVFMTISCINEDFLEPNPLSIFVPENIYVDKAGLQAVLLSLQRGLRDEFYSSHSLICVEHYASDIAICAGENLEIHNWNSQVTPTAGSSNNDAGIIRNYFSQAYLQIRNANVVISRIDIPVWNNEKDRDEVLAEAYFHRAYWYYRLVHQFGDVPFINKEYSVPKIDFYTHSRQTILDKIQSDLEFAVQWLPENVNPGGVSKGAGNHLLTKVYLANCEFDKAILSASAVLNSGKYNLMTNRFGKVASNPRFNVIWDLHQKENKSLAQNTEGILVAQDRFGYPGASTGGTNTMRNFVPFWSHGTYLKDPDGKAGMIQPQFDPQLLAFGRGVGIVRPSKYSNFEIWENAGTDLRHDSDTNWMPRSKILYNNPKSNYFGQPVQIKYSNPFDTLRSYYEWPHYKIYVSNEPTVGQPTGGNGDWYIFRLAETFLLRAEAYCWKGDYENALSDINEVRNRALAPPILLNEVSIDYILDERARELFAEEPRKTELTRIALIMAKEELNSYSLDNFSIKNYWYDRIIEKNLYNIGLVWSANEYKISPYHVFWPIPQEVIDANAGGVINQNISYPGTENNIAPLTEIMDE